MLIEYRPSVFDSQIKQHLRDGKQVMIVIDDEATIMKMTKRDKIRIVKAIVDFSLEDGHGMEFDNLAGSGATEPPTNDDGDSELPKG